METAANEQTQVDVLELNGVAVVDTFAEAFPIVGARLIVTAVNSHWATVAANQFCGFATSVIACDLEASVERDLTEDETPDGRPGVSILAFGFGRKALGESVANRVGQCILTCPTTACYNGIEGAARDQKITIGGSLRYFGDSFQGSKKLGKRRLWRIPVMDGEFLCEEKLGTAKGVAGGNLLICGANQLAALSAAEAAVKAMDAVPDTAQPFPGGIVRSGSKVGSRYAKLKASTNDSYCPTLKAITDSALDDRTNAVYEIVIDGLSEESVGQAMKAGLHAATQCDGVTQITAGNYGGKLGKFHYHLRDLLK